MVFTSAPFVVFFLLVLTGLAIAPNRGARQFLILCSSIFFYAYWKPVFVLLLAAPSVIDYFCALRIEESPRFRVRRRWLLVSLISNLGLLAYFKYTNFFVSSVAALFGVAERHFEIVLPIGISFYTFKTLSYTIDVYRGEIEACRSIWRFAMFVTYFPELVAGPIVRASVFLPQMTRSLRPSWSRSFVGLQVILLGITKKVLIADRLAPFVDRVFANPGEFSSATVCAGVVAYSIQIYCDFSGYSDIAIGVSRIIGFDLPENFNMPYAATSITEFWRRWHMTLSRWLRDYLYIPLGGNRGGSWSTYRNLFITMLLGGLWHGSSWTFVAWGAWHGVGLAIHKALRPGDKGPRTRIGSLSGWACTYAFVCLGWVFFRAQTFSDAITIFGKIFGVTSGGVQWLYVPLFLLIPLMAMGHAVGLCTESLFKIGGRSVASPPILTRLCGRYRFAMKPHAQAGIYTLLPLHSYPGLVLCVTWVLMVCLFAMTDANPFIYFQF